MTTTHRHTAEEHTVRTETAVDNEGDTRAGAVERHGLDEREVAALVVALWCRSVRAAGPQACVAPAPGALPRRMAWQGPAPHETVWTHRAG